MYIKCIGAQSCGRLCGHPWPEVFPDGVLFFFFFRRHIRLFLLYIYIARRQKLVRSRRIGSWLSFSLSIPSLFFPFLILWVRLFNANR